jgi:tryptophanase
MANVRFFTDQHLPLEMHKVRIVQKLNLPPIERRLEAITEAGNNTFLLQNRDIFLDMLTDSGVNAMSDQQLAAMMIADDSYAGSETFTKLENKLIELFGMPHFLPAHQGRACEHIIASTLGEARQCIVPMNFHFTTSKAHIVRCGGIVSSSYSSTRASSLPASFRSRAIVDLNKLRQVIEEEGAGNSIPFVRLEAGTNLIGGQPLSSARMSREVTAVCHSHGIPVCARCQPVFRTTCTSSTQREEACKDMSIREITRALADEVDVIYFSARKLGFAKGGGICVRDDVSCFEKMRELIPLFEGFLTYGGMSVREMEAIVVGLDETMDEDVISQGPQFIQFMTDELRRAGVPVVTPPGGLGCHLNAMEFLPHVEQGQYPAGALASALYIAGGVRGMERGTMSEAREPDGREVFSQMELLRLAMPRRVFTLSQVKYAIDRIIWLYEHRDLIGGLTFVEEPAILRFFFGKLKPTSDWQTDLAKAFREDFGDSL